jgi:hypothetical protein
MPLISVGVVWTIALVARSVDRLASLRRTSRSLAFLMVALGSGCVVTSESDHVEPYDPPPARTACEEAFRSRLMMDIGTAIEQAPAPAPGALEAVFAACTFPEMIAADEYYMYPSGPPTGRLMRNRLPGVAGTRPADLCEQDAFAATLACTSLASMETP